jgi:hypothetical protein
MTTILNFIKENNLKKFSDIRNILTKEPYFFEIKDNKELYMICMSEKSNITSKMCREATGIILEKNTNKVVHYSFPKTYENVHNPECTPSFNDDCLNNDLILDDDKFKIDLYFEGSVIKIYYYKGKWNLSSARHLDASSNRWSSKKMFDELFIECVENSYKCSYQDFLNNLDKECSHTYLFQHPEHLMILPVAEPVCYSLNKVNNETLEEFFPEQGTLTTSITSPLEIDQDTMGLTENYLVYHMDSTGKNIKNRIKVFSTKYMELKAKIGNFPDPGLRYIEAYGDCNDKMFVKYNYPSYSNVFDNIDILFNKAVNNLFFSYSSIFIKKTMKLNQIPYEQRDIIYNIHKNYLKTRVKVLSSDITSYLLNLSSREIANAIRYSY